MYGCFNFSSNHTRTLQIGNKYPKLYCKDENHMGIQNLIIMKTFLTNTHAHKYIIEGLLLKTCLLVPLTIKRNFLRYRNLIFHVWEVNGLRTILSTRHI